MIELKDIIYSIIIAIVGFIGRAFFYDLKKKTKGQADKIDEMQNKLTRAETQIEYLQRQINKGEQRTDDIEDKMK